MFKAMGSNGFLQSALNYTKHGLKVVALHSPEEHGGCTCGKTGCKHIGKHPRYHEGLLPHGANSATNDQRIVEEWYKLWPDANVAIATGKESGIIVLDIDPRNGGLESLLRLEETYGKLPPTPRVKTGGGGLHLYFKYPDKPVTSCVLQGFPGIEVLSDGKLAVAPPSRHASGGTYEWGVDLESIPLAAFPEFLLEMAAKKNWGTDSETVLGQKGSILEGERNTKLTSLAGKMRRQGMSEEEILVALLVVNKERCKPPLDEKEVVQIARSVARYPAGSGCYKETQKEKTGSDFPLTDLGNAERLIALHGHNLRYDQDRKKWLVWDGKRWAIDNSGEVMRMAKETIRSIYKEGCSTERKRGALLRRLESCVGMKGMIELAKTEKGIPVKQEELDSNKWLFNVLNGTVDLRTGRLLPHRKEDLITKLAPVEYDPEAKAPRWIEFLREITNGNAYLAAYLQKVVGYGLTGDTSEQVMFLLYGNGSNGKSTFLRTINALFGDYAAQTSSDTLVLKNYSSIPNDIARLKGKRLVIAAEVEEGKRLAESLVKQLTGGDKLAARFLYGEYFEFEPESKIFFAVNHKPKIRGVDNAIWRRIHLIPFEVEFKGNNIDRGLPDKLLQELPGIFNWALKGCQIWQIEGLNPPAEVIKATDDYRSDMDTLASFIQECCLVNPLARESVANLYNAYCSWCMDNGEKPLGKREFGSALEKHGFQRKRTSTHRQFQGIKLHSDKMKVHDRSDTISLLLNTR